MTSAELRGAILRILYGKWKSAASMGAVATNTEIAQELGDPAITARDVGREAEYLKDKGLLSYVGAAAGGEAYRPKAEGIDFVEHPQAFPQFLPMIVIQARGNVSFIGSQVGRAGTFEARINEPAWNPEGVLSILTALRESLNRATLDERLRSDVEANLDTFAAQARRTNPDRAVLRTVYSGLCSTVQTAAALQDLWPLLQQLGAYLSGG